MPVDVQAHLLVLLSALKFSVTNDTPRRRQDVRQLISLIIDRETVDGLVSQNHAEPEGSYTSAVLSGVCPYREVNIGRAAMEVDAMLDGDGDTDRLERRIRAGRMAQRLRDEQVGFPAQGEEEDA